MAVVIVGMAGKQMREHTLTTSMGVSVYGLVSTTCAVYNYLSCGDDATVGETGTGGGSSVTLYEKQSGLVGGGEFIRMIRDRCVLNSCS